MEMVYNTGETSKELKENYNPEGSTLRKAQLRMLDMLLYIDSICKKENIAWRLDGGNVLGALRHGGFIPWDDDVDIVLEYEEYKKLYKYLLNNPHPQYVLQCNKTDKGYYAHGWCVLRDTKSEYIQDSKMHNIRKYRGLQIDIFCYEKGVIPCLNNFAMKLYWRNLNHFAGKYPNIAQLVYNFEEWIEIPLFRFLSKLFGNKEYYMHSYGALFICRFHKDLLFPYTPIEFENYTFPGPANPKEFCRSLYGDFMSLPPIDKRDHHQAAYIIQE